MITKPPTASTWIAPRSLKAKQDAPPGLLNDKSSDKVTQFKQLPPIRSFRPRSADNSAGGRDTKLSEDEGMSCYSHSWIVAWCFLQVMASAATAADPNPRTFTRPSAVLERPQGGEATLPISWRSLAVTPNGKTVVAAGALPGRTEFGRGAVVAIWQAESGKLKNEKMTWAAGDLALSMDGKAAIVRSDRTRSLPAGGAMKSRPGSSGDGEPRMPPTVSYQHQFLHWILSEDQPTRMQLEIGKPAPGTPMSREEISIFGLQFSPGLKFGLGTSKGFLIWDYKPARIAGPKTADPIFTLPPAKAALDPNQFDRKVKSSLGIAGGGSLWIVQLQGGDIEGWDLRKGVPRFQFSMAGRDPVVAIPSDGKFFVLSFPAGAGKAAEVEIRGTDGEVTSRLKGGPTGSTLSLALTSDGSVLAAGGDDGTVTIWDVATGAVTDRIMGLTDIVWPLAISQKGTVVVSADKTGIQVWDLDRLRSTATPAADRPAPQVAANAGQPVADSDILARGPVTVTLKIGGKTETRELLGLTPQKLITRKPGELRFVVDTATAARVEGISTVDNRFSWKLDPKEKLFSGPVYSGRTPQLPEKRQAELSRDCLQTYLYLGWLRLKYRIGDVTQDPINAAEVGDLKELADVRSRFARSQKLDPRLAVLYSGLAQYVSTMQRESEAQRQVISEFEEQQRKLSADREKIRKELAPQRLMGFAAMFIGAAPTSTAVTDSYGQTWHVETGIVSEELFQQGLTSMLNTSLDQARRESVLKTAETIADVKMRDRLNKSVATVHQASDTLMNGFQALAAEPFAVRDLPEIDASELKPREKPAKGDAYRPLLEKLELRAARERTVLRQDNPFTLAEMEYVRSVAGPVSAVSDLATRIGHLRERSDRIAELAGLVPSDPAFDGDRAEMFARAGTLALRAGFEQVGPQHWADAFNEHADVARALFEKALTLAPRDSAGRWREQLAWSQVLSGRSAAGVKLAMSVATLRNRSSRFMYQLARAKCSVGMENEGYNDLEDAVTRLGFEDLIEAQSASDFPMGSQRFKDLLKPEVQLQKFNPNQPPDEFRVVNRSRFALRHARIRVTFRGTDLKGKPGNLETEKTVDEWQPGETVIVKAKSENRVVLPGPGFGGTAAPQPEVKVLVTTPKQGSASNKLE